MDLPPMDSYYDDLWHKQDIIYEYRKVLLVLYLIIVQLSEEITLKFTNEIIQEVEDEILRIGKDRLDIKLSRRQILSMRKSMVSLDMKEKDKLNYDL